MHLHQDTVVNKRCKRVQRQLSTCIRWAGFIEHVELTGKHPTQADVGGTQHDQTHKTKKTHLETHGARQHLQLPAELVSGRS